MAQPQPAAAQQAQAALNQAQAVAQAVAAANQVEQSRLPMFFADSTKDQFDAETWLDRVRNAARAANWDGPRTAAFALSALRGEALIWYRVTSKRLDLAAWPDFQRAFLNGFSTTRTTRTTTAIFDGLKQKPNENTVTYYGRVGKAFDDLKEIRPPQNMAFERYPAGWAGQAWNDIPDAEKEANALMLVRRGNTYADECSAAQYYVAGLRPEIRDRILINPPPQGFTDLWNTCQRAREIEQNLTDPSKVQATTATAAAIEEEEDEIDAINRRRFGGYRRGSRGRGFNRGRFNNSRTERFEGECHFCHKKGHMKKDCYAFKATQSKGRKVAGLEEEDDGNNSQHHRFEDQDSPSFVTTLDYLN